MKRFWDVAQYFCDARQKKPELSEERGGQEKYCEGFPHFDALNRNERRQTQDEDWRTWLGWRPEDEFGDEREGWGWWRMWR